MLSVRLYNYAKRVNSTAQPVLETGQAYSCQLKDTCNMLNPTLILKNVPVSWNPIYTYGYIPEFDRYYFITQWRWNLGLWECDMAVDVLASFKSQIGALDEYILRSSNEDDGTIADSYYPATCDIDDHMTMLDEFYVRALSGGFYVVGIIGKENTATQGAITYYQMTATQLARLRAYLLSDTFLTDQGLVNLADFVPADATKVIYNPYQYIVSCQWFPFPLSAIGSAFKESVTNITFGWWNSGTGFNAYRIKENSPVYDTYTEETIIDHPQLNRGSYLNHAPYTSRVLRLSPFGEIRLPDQYLDSGDKIRIQLQVDFITGQAVLTLYAVDSDNVYRMMLARQSQKIGVDIQLAQVGVDYYGTMSQYVADMSHEFSAYSDAAGKAITTAVTGAASGGGAGAIVGAAVGAFNMGASAAMTGYYHNYTTVGNYLKNSAPQVLSSGHNGSLADFVQNNYICTTFYKIVDEDNEQLGRPLCKVRQISDIPGYILVQSPDVEISCLLEEKNAIIAYMASGFYYE